MFHPPQASVGLALLPMAWAANERARDGRGMPPRANDDDLVRYFPAAYERDSLPDAPRALGAWLRRVASAWQASALASRLRHWSPGFGSRG